MNHSPALSPFSLDSWGHAAGPMQQVSRPAPTTTMHLPLRTPHETPRWASSVNFNPEPHPLEALPSLPLDSEGGSASCSISGARGGALIGD
jgi:hypothetical protein